MEVRIFFRNSCHILILCIFLFLTAGIHAQTRSRIAGTVKDAKTGETLIGANIVVENTYLGAASNRDGKFFIVNVPIGTYDLKVSMIGYQTQMIKNVEVSADRITNLDIELVPHTIQTKEVLVTAAREDKLHKDVSGTNIVTTSKELNNSASVRSVQTYLERLPGVSTQNGYISIRGGSPDQTGTMVNGLAFNNAAVGNTETSVPLSAIKQISVLSGGFNAEYGNFRSGLINITTKSGSRNKYSGTFSLSIDNTHLRRFGASLYDPHNSILAPYLDPSIAFIGTDSAYGNNEYEKQQHLTFDGWISEAEKYNKGKSPDKQVTPLDLYLLSAWMHMVVPDYKGLAKLGYKVSDEQKKLFAQHANNDELGQDFDFDGGFGGPIPFVSGFLGDATFYISNHSSVRHYTEPVTLKADKKYTTLATIESHPTKSWTVTINGLWKREIGVSPIKPPNGEMPDAENQGGFMPSDNIQYVANSDYKPTYFYDPPVYPILDQTTILSGININHVLNPSTYFDLTLSYLNIRDHSPTGSNRDTTILTYFGPIPISEMPYGKRIGNETTHELNGFIFPGYDKVPGEPFRFAGKEGDLHDNSVIGQYEAKFDISSQLDEHNFVKSGIEYNLFDLNHFFWEQRDFDVHRAVYEFNYHRKPSQTGLYVQDQVSYEEVVANIGVRFDYYYGGGGLWPTGDPFNEQMFTPQSQTDQVIPYLMRGQSYIWHVWEEYNKTHPGFLQPIKNYLTISPRVGISFPVTMNSKFYFNYGHFRSNPPYYTMYEIRYRYRKKGLYSLANPNLEPPRTIAYELGMAYNFYNTYILNVSGYYKDEKGEHGKVTYQNAAGSIDYNTWANNYFQDIQGLEVNISKNDNSWFTGSVNFNYLLEKSGSTGRKIITDKTINNDQAGLYSGSESRSLPRPQLNATITFRTPKDWGPRPLGLDVFGNWGLTFFGEWHAGKYFTWNPLGKLHVNDNMQWPDYYMVNLKLSRRFEIAGLSANVYLDVRNLFNFKVNLLYTEYPYDNSTTDMQDYLASLHLPMYDSHEYDDLRAKNPNQYIAGNDKIGDMRSSDKPYINNPNYPEFLYSQPRDIWLGLRVDF